MDGFRLKVIKEIFEGDEDVLLAYLFGSRVKGLHQPISDIDIAVLLRDNSLEKQAALTYKIAKALKIPEDRVDLVDLSRASPHLKYNVLRCGVKLIDRGLGESLTREVTELSPERREEFSILLRSWLCEDPQINREALSRRIDEILRNTALIRERYAGKPLGWLLEDLERTLALERAMERIIEAMVDICRHLVSAKMLGLVEERSEYPLRLAEHKIMPKDLAEKVAELARLRNILAHRYLEVDYARLQAKALEVAEQTTPSFIKWLRGLLKG